MRRINIKAWLHASRPRTLPLAFSSSLMGSFVAWHDLHFRWAVFGMALLTTLFLQVLSNLANDYGDSVNGADNPDRVGPRRAVQSGDISLGQMKSAVIITSALALISGILLIGSGIGFTLSTGWLVFLLLGIMALSAAIMYTAGSKPYGYIGLGDLFVFLFFGLAGVLGTYFLHTATLRYDLLLPATASGLLSTAVLNLNNMRDIKGDALSGKRTLVVIIGSAWAKVYHAVLVSGALVALTIWTIIHYNTPQQFLFLLMVPVFAQHLAVVFRNKIPAELDPQLKKLALATFATVVIFGATLMF
jgi:1,4-dihydroxy-2-naphthoate octaprenyltransferase